MTHLLHLLLSTVGVGLLCLARERHQGDMVGRKLAAETGRRIRSIGILTLLLAYVLAAGSLGWAYGLLEWLGSLSVSAVLTMALLSARSYRKSARR